ncbi:periplasmic heavy metal sensor [Tateyamaria sp.]|uniref:periplasmic heavy metal sensor n=1 Tax=Tateyamaria sp. TaxID=1929288 RepID=UPI00329E3B19
MDDNKPHTPRRMKIILAASLAVNVLVLGALAGAAFHGGDRGPRMGSRGGGENAAIGIYGRALDKADRRAIGTRLHKGREDGRAIRAELRELATQSVGMLRQSPFDKDAFAEVLLQQQGLIKTHSDDMQSALVEHVSTMSDAQRAAYAQKLQDTLDRGPRRKKGEREKP